MLLEVRITVGRRRETFRPPIVDGPRQKAFAQNGPVGRVAPQLIDNAALVVDAALGVRGIQHEPPRAGNLDTCGVARHDAVAATFAW